jgi:hypothetical protein
MMQLLTEARKKYGSFEAIPLFISRHFSKEESDGLTTFRVATSVSSPEEGEKILRSVGAFEIGSSSFFFTFTEPLLDGDGPKLKSGFPEERKKPNGFYKYRRNCVNAVIRAFGSFPPDALLELTHGEFEKGVPQAVDKAYKEDHVLALLDAGLITASMALQMRSRIKPSRARFNTDAKRFTALENFIMGCGKLPHELGVKDFETADLLPLFPSARNRSPYALFQAAHNYFLSRTEPEGRAKAAKYNFKAWQMKYQPKHIFDKRVDRIAAMEWIVELARKELGKEPRELTFMDFKKYNLDNLLRSHYNHSPYEALLDADLVTPADEQYMRSIWHARSAKAANSKTF